LPPEGLPDALPPEGSLRALPVEGGLILFRLKIDLDPFLTPEEMKFPFLGASMPAKVLPWKRSKGIYPENPVMSGIIEMIGDELGSIAEVYNSVEVIQNEISGGPEIILPERIGDPRIKVIVIRRRSVVGDYWRPLVVIIVFITVLSG
jgi:hypothetical protein